MIPEQPGSRGPAALAQQALVALLWALALWALVSLLMGARDAIGMRSSWAQVPVTVQSGTADGQWEVELHERDLAQLGPVQQPAPGQASEPDHVRVLVPARPYSLLDRLDPAVLARHPGEPGRVALVDLGADLFPALAQLAWALVLAAAVLWLGRRLDWGRDLTWNGQDWAHNPLGAMAPGGMAGADAELREPRSSQTSATVAAGVFGALALWTLGAAVIDGGEVPIEVGFTLLLTVPLGLGAMYFAVLTRSRSVRHDASGVADGSWFGTRRTPYSAIVRWERVNDQAQAQARFEARSPSQRKGVRPRDQWAWVAYGSNQALLFKVAESMQPATALTALHERIAAHGQPLAAGGTGASAGHAAGGAAGRLADDLLGRDGDEDEALSPAQAAEWQRMEQLHQQLSGRANDGLRWGFLVVIAPFVAMFGFAAWSALQYQFMSDRVWGTVVERRVQKLVQLSVSYVAADGRERRLETDGTRANDSIALGQKISVLVRRDNPELAKIETFWAVWIWPVILGGLLLIVAVPFGYGFVIAPAREEVRLKRIRPGAGPH